MQRLLVAVVVCILGGRSASAGQIFFLSDLSGLSAELEFTLLDPTTLEVRAKNTSTGVPDNFNSSDQLLTGVSWDFGHPGYNGDAQIIGGCVVIGDASTSVNFNTGTYGPGFDVSGEYGYGNEDGTGALPNFITATAARATPFGGANLDGPVSIDGPQAGLVPDPIPVFLGGLGAIQNEIITTLALSEPLPDLGCLQQNLVRVEFGSNAFFITSPEPATALLLLVGCGLQIGRRQRHPGFRGGTYRSRP